ncbi:DUF1427 family protein [Paraburkholderia sp. RL18-085-BIA-A]|uniref:DUF1427 family protein n=1 Tax=Paraburkholderia sp. RL18-085-BIA-A TaxID=3031633 RepID=UPI0038B7160C
MKLYLLSLGAGALVGVIYSPCNSRPSPCQPASKNLVTSVSQVVLWRRPLVFRSLRDDRRDRYPAVHSRAQHSISLPMAMTRKDTR